MTFQQGGPSSRRFEISGVLSAMGKAVGGNPIVFFGLALLLQGIPAAVVGVIQWSYVGPMYQGGGFMPRTDLADMGRAWAMSAIGALVSIISTNVLQAALTHGVLASLLGRRASFQECLASGLRFFLPALGIGIISGVCMILGLIFFIVPGVLIALTWCVSVPVAVSEGRGVFQSLGRSAFLTDGHKGSIFLLFLIYIGISWVLGLLATALGAAFMAVSMQAYILVVGVIASPIVNSIASVFGASGAASIYYELRSAKEGIGAEQLAQVFE
jgi:hypothetical protein